MLHGEGGNHTNALSGLRPNEAVALVVDGQPLPPMAMVTVDGGARLLEPPPRRRPDGRWSSPSSSPCARA